jgi:hypothetical protein
MWPEEECPFYPEYLSRHPQDPFQQGSEPFRGLHSKRPKHVEQLQLMQVRQGLLFVLVWQLQPLELDVQQQNRDFLALQSEKKYMVQLQTMAKCKSSLTIRCKDPWDPKIKAVVDSWPLLRGSV